MEIKWNSIPNKGSETSAPIPPSWYPAKSEIVNVRQGHSFDYPIKFIYRKKNLPVKIIDVWENFKKIQDYNNNQGWIHVSKLSKRKAAINIKNNSIIFKKPTIFSKPLARLEKGRLVLVKKCKN